jgi:hypothetical protein
MDKLETYCNILRELVIQHSQHQPSHGQIESVPICDPVNHNYAVLDIGWDNTGRVHAMVFHLRIQQGKVWVEWDGTEPGITQELLDAGIPREDIVLGFYRPERRALTGFAQEPFIQNARK